MKHSADFKATLIKLKDALPGGAVLVFGKNLWAKEMGSLLVFAAGGLSQSDDDDDHQESEEALSVVEGSPSELSEIERARESKWSEESV